MGSNTSFGTNVITIRPAQASDLDLIFTFSEDSIDSLQSKSMLETYYSKGALLVINRFDKVVGFIVEQVLDNEAELLQIVVSKAYQRKGVASAALHYWHEALNEKGVELVFLEVRTGNLAAVALYQHLGYQIVGKRKNYYRFGDESEDALVMKVEL